MKRKPDYLAWQALLLERGAPADLARAWSSFARTSIELIPEDVRSVDDTALRASKLSGAPDLPIGAAWPSSAQTSKPLAFIAQINLRDVASIGCDLPIPHEGHLLFFYDEEEQPWGFDPRQAGGWRVMFVGANAAISRQQGNANHSPRVRLLRLSPSENLPPWEWLREKIANESWYDRDVFFEAIEKVELYGAYNHQFGGWANPIQGPMELECAMASSGISAGGPEGYQDPRVSGLRLRADAWKLLLQIASDDEIGWMWGDCGMLYFHCREEDVAEGQFEHAWTILQCT